MIDAIGYFAGLFLMMSFAPQVYKTIKTKSVHDISLLLLLFTIISAILYEIYAVSLNLIPVMIMNGIFTVLVLFELILYIKLQKKSIDKKVNY